MIKNIMNTCRMILKLNKANKDSAILKNQIIVRMIHIHCLLFQSKIKNSQALFFISTKRNNRKKLQIVRLRRRKVEHIRFCQMDSSKFQKKRSFKIIY